MSINAAQLSTAFAGLSASVGHAAASNAAAVSPTPESAALAHAPQADMIPSVLRGVTDRLGSDLKWSNPANDALSKTGIIIVGGKSAVPKGAGIDNPLTQNGIIIVGGRPHAGKTFEPRPLDTLPNLLSSAANGSQLDTIKRRFDDATKDFEAQDKLGNFEIQGLMGQYNQSETLSSNVQKKQDDTANSVIGKI